MQSLCGFTDELRTKLRTATKTDKPRELLRADSTYKFCCALCNITDVPELLERVTSEVFPSHADIQQLLTIYADRLSWHVLPGEKGMDERDRKRLIIQSRDTERALADQLMVLRCHLRSSDLKEADRVREATLLVNGFYVHLRLLSLLDTLRDQASKVALQKCRKEYQRFVTEYRAERKRRCSVSISDSRTEVTVQDSGKTFTVQLTMQVPENVDLDKLKEMYLKSIIYDLDFIGANFSSLTVPTPT